MHNQSGKIALILIVFFLFFGIVTYFILRPDQESPNIEGLPTKSVSVEEYSSEDLKISLEYPSDWFIDEEYYYVMLTSYPAKLDESQKPTEKQIELGIHNYNGGCHETIDENLKDPACGEGGKDVKLNEILSKEIEEVNGANFYKYLIRYPEGREQRFYFLEKGETILQIDKSPDPSMFEKEFEDLVKSIRFN